MPVHRILVERDQHVELVAHTTHRAIAGANSQKGVAAPDDGLIGIVGIDVEAPARENAGQDVAGAGNALAVLAANSHRKINSSHARFLCELAARTARALPAPATS